MAVFVLDNDDDGLFRNSKAKFCTLILSSSSCLRGNTNPSGSNPISVVDDAVDGPLLGFDGDDRFDDGPNTVIQANDRLLGTTRTTMINSNSFATRRIFLGWNSI
jgi:hypothetical protein